MKTIPAIARATPIFESILFPIVEVVEADASIAVRSSAQGGEH
jgi:hypothetical protein